VVERTRRLGVVHRAARMQVDHKPEYRRQVARRLGAGRSTGVVLGTCYFILLYNFEVGLNLTFSLL